MLSLTDLVCTIFLIPKGSTGDADVLPILCISAVVIWLSHKVWAGLFGATAEATANVSSTCRSLPTPHARLETDLTSPRLPPSQSSPDLFLRFPTTRTRLLRTK